MHPERSEPILPARDLEEIRTFYSRLGFRAWFGAAAPWPYEILSRGNLVVHFYLESGLDPARNNASCYWRVPDAGALHGEFSSLNLPDAGIPRLTPPADQPWHMREFALVDPSGNLVRIGNNL
ncbi:MAG TPA: VOC family protein [Bryobacteraceae bacterium]|nr:VOC family protein [Bryobacteraceae bacterium]